MNEYLLLAAGITLLVLGGNWLVDGASALARRAGVPTLVIGLTIVAFGTSVPELVVSVLAAVQGSSGIAFGNIIGSNIANILLILGIAALISPITVQRSTTWKEIPFSLLAAGLLFSFALAPALDGTPQHALLHFEGIVLLLVFCVFLVYVIEMARKGKAQAQDENAASRHAPWRIGALLCGGLVALYFGGEWTVSGAVAIAKSLGASEFLISATIIAVGTSLPELVTTVIAARRGEADLAAGNIVGSNIFNILWILGVTALIAPVAFPADALLDIGMVLVATALLFGFLFIGRRHELKRWQGGMFLLLYAGYIASLIWRG